MDCSILSSQIFQFLAVYQLLHFGSFHAIIFYQPSLSDDNGIGSKDKATLATLLATAGKRFKIQDSRFKQVYFPRRQTWDKSVL